MRINRTCKIWKATSKDELRESLQYVYFDGKDKLVATDGNIMAVVKVLEVEKDEDTPRLISADFLKSSRPTAKQHYLEINLNSGSATTTRGGFALSCSFPDEKIKFPLGYKKILAAAKKLLIRKKHKFVVGLDAKLLKNLADALDCDINSHVFLHFDKKELYKTGTCLGHIPVTVFGNDNFGIIMPVRVN